MLINVRVGLGWAASQSPNELVSTWKLSSRISHQATSSSHAMGPLAVNIARAEDGIGNHGSDTDTIPRRKVDNKYGGEVE